MTVSPSPTTLSERWFRTTPDSSVLTRPRLLARLLIDVADLDDQIAFYEGLLGGPADLRMPIPDFGGLELAAVGNLLLIASARPFTPIQRQTAYSLIVPSLSGQLERLPRIGTIVLEPTETIVPGSRARVRYPDGSLAELVEHRPQPGELPRPPAGGRPGSGGVRLLARKAVSRAAFGDAVRLYESALETDAEVRAGRGGPDAAQLAVVGNLLIVGSGASEPDDAERIAFALITTSADELSGTAEGIVLPHPGDGRQVVKLPGGVVAEVWDAKTLGA